MVLQNVYEQLLIITELRGSYPDLALPSDIDMEGLESDLGFKPKLVTLPIGRVNGRSRNGRIYSEQAVRDIVDAVNTQRLEGAWGHMRDEDRPYVYVPPSIRWVYAELKGDTAYGLGIPLDAETDKYFRAAARMNAKVGTSVYGTGTAQGSNIVGFKGAEKLDIADPMRVGIPDTAAIPQIGEMENEDTDMPEITMNDVPDAVRQQILEQFSSQQNSARVTEMESEMATLREQVATLTTERDASRGEASKLLVTYAKSKIAESVQLELVRELVEERVGIRETDDGATIEGVSTVAELDTKIKAALESDTIKKFNVDAVAEMMGPNWTPPAGGKNEQPILGSPIPS